MEKEKCAVILTFTMKLCVVMPGASYDKCVNNGVQEFLACTMGQLKHCIEECYEQKK